MVSAELLFLQDPVIIRNLSHGLYELRNEIAELITQLKDHEEADEREDFLGILQISLDSLDLGFIVRRAYNKDLMGSQEMNIALPEGQTRVDYYKTLADNLTPESIDLYALATMFQLIENPNNPVEESLVARLIEISMEILTTGERSLARVYDFEETMKKILSHDESSMGEELEALFYEIFSAWLISEAI